MSCAVSSKRFSVRMPAWRKEHENLSANGDCAVFLHDVAGIRMNMKDGEQLDHPTGPAAFGRTGPVILRVKHTARNMVPGKPIAHTSPPGVLAPPFVRATGSSGVQHGSVRNSPPLILGLTFVTSAIPSLLVFVEQSEHPTSSAAPALHQRCCRAGSVAVPSLPGSVLARW